MFCTVHVKFYFNCMLLAAVEHRAGIMILCCFECRVCFIFLLFLLKSRMCHAISSAPGHSFFSIILSNNYIMFLTYQENITGENR